MDQNLFLRNLTAEEVVMASELADRIYPSSLYEPLDSFESKFRAFPNGVFGCFDGTEMVGYVFSHPWTKGEPVPLASSLSLPENPDCYYIHDLAVSPSYRKSGFGRRLAIAALDCGRTAGFRNFSLLSVNKTEGFWSRFGFKPVNAVRYGENDATSMRLCLSKKWNGTPTAVIVRHFLLKKKLSEFETWCGSLFLYDGYIDYRSC
jgi:GNAT superfamily N-acetyltransferase